MRELPERSIASDLRASESARKREWLDVGWKLVAEPVRPVRRGGRVDAGDCAVGAQLATRIAATRLPRKQLDHRAPVCHIRRRVTAQPALGQPPRRRLPLALIGCRHHHRLLGALGTSRARGTRRAGGRIGTRRARRTRRLRTGSVGLCERRKVEETQCPAVLWQRCENAMADTFSARSRGECWVPARQHKCRVRHERRAPRDANRALLGVHKARAPVTRPSSQGVAALACTLCEYASVEDRK